jgi:hypothetical protein
MSTKMREALERMAIERGIKKTHTGAGWSGTSACKLCGATWKENDGAQHADTCPLARIEKMQRALELAHQFISNGIELGYIKMPAMPHDPAHRTLPLIEAALKEPVTT